MLIIEGEGNEYGGPPSSKNSQGGSEGARGKGQRRREDVENEGGENMEEDQSDSGSGPDFGEGVPLTRLSKPRNRGREGRSKGKGVAGGRHTDAKKGGGEGGEGIVVRWSQDGGSPTSFRRLKKQHMGKQGGQGPSKKRRRRNGGNGVDSDEESMEGVREGWRGHGGRKVLGVYWAPDEEAKLVRKMDKWLVGFLAGLYMLSFLDRSSACA